MGPAVWVNGIERKWQRYVDMMDVCFCVPLTWAHWVAQLISYLGEIIPTILYAGDHSESATCRFLLIRMKCWLFIAADPSNLKGIENDYELHFLTHIRPVIEAKYIEHTIEKEMYCDKEAQNLNDNIL